MRTRKTKGLWLELMTVILCAILCAGIVSAAYAASGSSSYVNFDANGGNGWMGTVYPQDGSWIQPDSEFTYPGHSFIGWSTSPNGPVQYLPGDVAYLNDPGMPDNNDPWMYAIWGEMSAEEMQASLAPKIYALWSTKTERVDGVSYAKAELRFGLKSSLGDENLAVFLRLGSADGPLLPGTQTVSAGDIQSYSLTNNYVWVSVPFLDEGVEQVIEDGTVNGLLSDQKVYVTLARVADGIAGESNPVVFSCTRPVVNDEEDEIAWFADSGNGTVAYGDYSATVTLTQDTVLPAEGLTLGYNSYHILLNGHTLTGTLVTAFGETSIEHEASGGTVLAAYTNNRQTLTFSAYGFATQPTGSVTVRMNNWGSFVCDPAYMTATVTNGNLLTQGNYTAETLQNWGYANTGNANEYEIAELSEDALAGYIPKNVTVTPQDDGLIVECDYEPEARQININVDVILSDGSLARLISDTPASSKDQVMSLEGQRQPFFIGSLRRLSDDEEQEVSENGEQKYVNGFHGGDRLSVTMNFKIGPHMQDTPWSSPAVAFTYSNNTIGKTFAQGSNNPVNRNFLPSVATLTVYSPTEVTYFGEPAFLDYSLTLNDGTPLVLGTDYTEEYINNYQPGTATLAVIGLGAYSGRITQPFTINPIDLADEDVVVTLAYDRAIYDGGNQTPSVIVSYDGWTLSESSHYYVNYSDNVNPGTAHVTLTPGYNRVCTGERVLEFTIDPRSMESGAVYATLSQNRYEWTGTDGTYEPEVTSVKWGGTALTEDTDYTVSYENNTAAGTAYAVLTGLGNYDGTYRIPFTIYQPVDLGTAATIDPIAPEIYNRTAQEPEVTVRVGNKVLTKGWDYSVAYSNNVNAGEATVTVTGRRDYTGTTTASFVVDPADLGVLAAQGGLTMTLKKEEYPYGDAVYTFSGGENKPTATLTIIDPEDSWNNVRLYEGTSYTLSFENNTEAGTATAIATGMGNYGGMCTAEFTINPLNLNDTDMYSASVASATYNGQAQTPAISMYTTYLDENRYTKYNYLTEGTDYTVSSWTNNTNAGTATVTVTGAGNNFTGTRAIDFTISPMSLSIRDFDLSAIATRVGEDGAELHNLTVTWKQNGRNLVEGTDFTVENLYSSGSYAYFYLKGMGNFGSQTGTYDLRLTDEIGTLPASGNFGTLSSWTISASGVMTIKGQGTLSKQDVWSNYAGLVKKIVVENYAATNKFSEISSGTFEDFCNATECTLPEGVTTVNSYAFPNTANKMVVHLADTVTTIIPDYNGNFSRVRALVNPGSATEDTILNSESYSYFGYEGYPDFLLWDSHNEERGLMLTGYFGSGGTVTIPGFVDTIESSGFERYGINKVIIPGSVKSMNAFLQNCYDLRELVIQPGNLLTKLPYQFISGCNNITIYIPDNITTIDTLNYYSRNNMLIVANCDSYAIEWAKNQTSWGSPIWAEETARTYGPRYRMIHRNPTEHAGKAATCTEDGWTAYITCSTCNYNNKTDLPALGHSWGDVTYSWNSEHTEVTATRVCKHDASHKETQTVSATSAVTVPATCVSEGERTYTSAVFTNPVFRVQKYKTVLPVTGHAWSADPSTAATDTADGIRGGETCDACGEQKPQRTVSARKLLKIPAMMNTIEAEAFMATAAEQINVPAGTESIEDGAFANCDNLLLVVIPGTRTAITGDPFAGSDVAVICPDNSTAAAWCDAHGISHNP